MSRAGRTRYRARWVVPIVSPPIEHGWVETEGGVVREVGTGKPTRRDAVAHDIDLGCVCILPGLVNAHTHLELSAQRGAVPPASSMPAWAAALMARLACEPKGERDKAIRGAIDEMYRAGTALVGDVANTPDPVAPLEAGPIDAVVFHEVLGFDVSAEAAAATVEALAGRVSERAGKRVSLRGAAHAPYSVSPALFRALAAGLPGPRSVHLAESREECEFLLSGSGAWRKILEARGRCNPEWQPPRCGSVAYLDSLGWLGSDSLLVHAVQLTPAEIRRVAASGATIVTCPRSNAWTGAGVPPVAAFYAAGAAVAVGTDSLASAPDLNTFAELACLRRLAPEVPARSLLRSATLTGARALGRGRSHGAIEPSRRAALVAVRTPEAVRDVEEYLLSGIAPEQVAWLDRADDGDTPRRCGSI
jgi:cytosine/adenosine deaminase-related metal-dependent hydrolase